MLKSKKLLRSLLVLAALAPVAPAFAADADTYLGVGVGAVQSKGHTNELFGDILGVDSTNKTSSTGFKVYWGYAFRPNLAVEVAYANLGTVAKRDWTPATDTTAALKVSAWSGTLVGRLPVGSGFTLFGKAGPYVADQTQTMTGTVLAGGDTKTNSTQTGLTTGLGADWRVDKAWSVRVEWDGYWGLAKNLTFEQSGVNAGLQNGNGISVHLFSVGAAFHF